MTAKITKQTHQDLMVQFESLDLDGYVINYDPNEMYLFTKDWGDAEEQEGTKYYRYSYSMDGPSVQVDKESKVEIKTKFDYEVVTESSLEKAIGKLTSVIEKNFGGSKREVKLIKQFNEKTKTVIEPLWIAYGEVDGQGDGYKNKEAVHQLVEAINKKGNFLQKAINHTHRTDCFDIVKAWVIEEESILGDVKIPALQPVVELKYTDKAFKLRKQGKLLGPSIGCVAWDVEIVKSLLDELRTKSKEPKRLLAEFDFEKKASHLSITTPSVGGPASQKDWHIEVNKSMLDPEAMALITEELEEEFTPLEKQLKGVDSKIAPSTSATAEAQDAGVDKKPETIGKQSEMSDKTEKEIALEKQLEELQAKVAKAEVEKSLSKYELEDQLASELADTLAPLKQESVAVITKALDFYVSALTSEKEAKAEIEKQLSEKPKEENELAKMLESGQQSVSTPDSEHKAAGTLGQRASARYNELKQDK